MEQVPAWGMVYHELLLEFRTKGWVQCVRLLKVCSSLPGVGQTERSSFWAIDFLKMSILAWIGMGQEHQYTLPRHKGQTHQVSSPVIPGPLR